MASCMILFMSVALLVVMLPLQAYGATVNFTYCDPLDASKSLVSTIDMERTPVVLDKEIVTFEIGLGAGFKDEDLSGQVNLSLSTFLPSGKKLGIISQIIELNYYPMKYAFLNALYSEEPVDYEIVWAELTTGNELMCVKIEDVPLV